MTPPAMAGALLPQANPDRSTASHPVLTIAPEALADPAPNSAKPADLDTSILVGAILVSGTGPLPQRAFMAAIQPFVGHTLSDERLSALASAIAEAARSQGYPLARAFVPAQALEAGVLTVTLNLGHIDRISLSGAPSPAARAILAGLIGHPITRAELERRIALANDLPGITLEQVHFAIEDGQGVLSAVVARKAIGVSATLDNRGFDGLGPARMLIAYDINGLLSDDRLSLSGMVLTTPAHLSEQIVIGTRLSYALDNAGSNLEISGTRAHSHPGGSLLPYDLASNASFVDVTYSRPLARSRQSSVWVAARAAFVDERQWQGGIGTEHDREMVLSIAMNGFARLAGGQLRGGLTFSRLIELGGGTGMPGSANATLASAWLNWQRNFGSRLGLRLAMNGQISTNPLPIYNQIVLGGPSFGRAYDIAERTGDEGLLGLAEGQLNIITRPHGALQSAQLYGFVDGGFVTILGAGSENASAALMSAGMGSRLRLGNHIAMEFEAAWPINQPRQATGTYSPRLSTSLGTSF